MITRRECLTNLAAAGMMSTLQGWRFMEDKTLLNRAIPSTGELLPAVGLGTWQTFDVGTSAADRAPLVQVLQAFVNLGGKVIDSSPMYGKSEQVVGAISEQAIINSKLFIATKVWTTGESSGINQMNESFALLKRKQMDLMQIHNLLDWQTHLKTLRKWKEQGKVRYIGLTHYTDSSHDTLVSIVKNNPVDFIQVNYNILDHNAEKNLLPFAQEKKVAILINRPFEEGALFQKVKGKNLPKWAGEFDCESWAQFFLKFILSHPAVTCVIPGTAKVNHMIDNLQAGIGKLPDGAQRKRMVQFIEEGLR